MKKQMLCWLSGLMMLAGISLMVDAVASYVLAQPPGGIPQVCPPFAKAKVALKLCVESPVTCLDLLNPDTCEERSAMELTADYNQWLEGCEAATESDNTYCEQVATLCYKEVTCYWDWTAVPLPICKIWQYEQNRVFGRWIVKPCP